MRLWGKCECCETLRSERDFLRALIRPKPEAPYNPLPVVTLEADGIISGNDQQIQNELSPDEIQRRTELEAERDRVLSGNY